MYFSSNTLVFQTVVASSTLTTIVKTRAKRAVWRLSIAREANDKFFVSKENNSGRTAALGDDLSARFAVILFDDENNSTRLVGAGARVGRRSRGSGKPESVVGVWNRSAGCRRPSSGSFASRDEKNGMDRQSFQNGN